MIDMGEMITEQSLFKPKASKAETKADTTTNAARTIIDAEAEKREAKTARLRQARLDQEALAAEQAAPAKPKRAKVAAPRKTKSSK
jgi:hypothetical protein